MIKSDIAPLRAKYAPNYAIYAPNTRQYMCCAPNTRQTRSIARHDYAILRHHFTTIRVDPLRPNVSGLYISSALVGGITNSPGVVARAVYVNSCTPAPSNEVKASARSSRRFWCEYQGRDHHFSLDREAVIGGVPLERLERVAHTEAIIEAAFAFLLDGNIRAAILGGGLLDHHLHRDRRVVIFGAATLIGVVSGEAIVSVPWTMTKPAP